MAAVTGLTLVSLGVPWLPPLNPALHAAFHHQDPGVHLLLVTGQAAALGLACALAGTSLARATRPGLPAGVRGGIAVMAHWLPK